jgi:hypothetical protein
MAKKGFFKFLTGTAVIGAVTAGVVYFLKHKSDLSPSTNDSNDTDDNHFDQEDIDFLDEENASKNQREYVSINLDTPQPDSDETLSAEAEVNEAVKEAVEQDMNDIPQDAVINEHNKEAAKKENSSSAE